jgi:hypothetical protein
MIFLTVRYMISDKYKIVIAVAAWWQDMCAQQAKFPLAT